MVFGPQIDVLVCEILSEKNALPQQIWVQTVRPHEHGAPENSLGTFVDSEILNFLADFEFQIWIIFGFLPHFGSPWEIGRFYILAMFT